MLAQMLNRKFGLVCSVISICPNGYILCVPTVCLVGYILGVLVGTPECTWVGFSPKGDEFGASILVVKLTTNQTNRMQRNPNTVALA
jgi:hypothetical protein